MTGEKKYWAAVLERDSLFDGVFVYGVRSTGIYCRPSCPARRPHRRNVTFFRGPEDADSAGFRPCLRCGERICYAIADSPLGKMLVASTEKGVRAVSIGDSGWALESELVKEYAAAEIRTDDSGLHRHITVLLRYLRGKDLSLNHPLDIRITAFQAKVYNALRKIPCGQTRTYAEIAAAVDLPRAIRAVGRACATNPIALAIPCHRVVRKDGTLGGYRWV